MKQIILSLVCCVLILNAQAQSRETRNLSSFNSLSVSEAIKVTLEKGSSEKAVLEVSGTDADNVLTDVSGNSLRIHMRSGNWKNVDVHITLTYKSLEEIDVSSAAKVTADDPIVSETMEIDVSSAGHADLNLKAGEMEVDISSAGKLEAEGSVDEIEVDVSSAGSMHAYDLVAKKADLYASSAGSIKLSVTEEIKASASSGGSVKYKGNPEKERVSSSAGGSVKGDDW